MKHLILLMLISPSAHACETPVMNWANDQVKDKRASTWVSTFTLDDNADWQQEYICLVDKNEKQFNCQSVSKNESDCISQGD